MRDPTAVSAASVTGVDPLENDPRFRCCCNSTTIRLGTVIFCWTEIAVSVLKFVVCAWALVSGTGDLGNNYYSIIGPIITIPVASLVLVGLKEDNKKLLFTTINFYLVWLVADTVMVIIIGITAMALLPFGSANSNRLTTSSYTPTVTTLAVTSIIQTCVNIWLFWILFKLYRYYEAKGTVNVYTMLPYKRTSNIQLQ